MKKILILCLFFSITAHGQCQLKSTQTLNAPITTAGSVSVCPNGSFNIPITVTNFSQVRAVTLRLDFNPNLLTYNSFSNSNSSFPGGLSINSAQESSTVKMIKISWSETTEVSLNNGSKLVDLNFTLLSGSPTLEFNNTSQNGGQCEFAYGLGDVFIDEPTSTYFIPSTITNLGPATPANISGATTVNRNQSNVAYTVPAIANATSYSWTLPAGATATSTSSSINVDYGPAAVSGNITVKGYNALCGYGATSTLTVTVANSIFTAASSNDWNTAANWDNGIPAAITNVDIATGKLAVINSLNNACADLTIAASAQLIINAGKTLTVNGTLFNSTGNSGLLIKSDASGTGSLLHNTTGVNASIERYLTGNVYHQIGLPINNTISAGTNTGQTGNVFLNCSLDKYDEASNNYLSLNSSNAIAPDQGYMVNYTYIPATPAPTFKVLSFAGTLNTGIINFPITKTGLGYNLIPNPYPSSIDWNASSGWNKSLLANNTIYIWNQGSAAPQWATYDGSVQVNGGSQYIAPGQAFFVTAASNGSIQMNNNARLHNSIGFLKSGNTISDNFIRLKVSIDTSNNADETVIYFSNNPVSQGSEKWLSFVSTAPSLYSIKNNVKYAINILDDANSNNVIPLDFKAGVDGSYILNAIETVNFSLCSAIFLEDLQTMNIQNLLNQPIYSFSALSSDLASRFNLHFMAAPNAIDEFSIRKTRIYAYNYSIYVNTSEKPKQITVYNLLGQLLKTIIRPTDGMQKIDMNGIKQGCYIVRVITDKKVYSEKIILK